MTFSKGFVTYHLLSKHAFIEYDSKKNNNKKYDIRSSGGRVLKLLACGARGPGFDSPPRHLNFRDWLSPASKSRYG